MNNIITTFKNRIEYKTYYSNNLNDYVLSMQDLNSKFLVNEIVAQGKDNIIKYIDTQIESAKNQLEFIKNLNDLSFEEFTLDIINDYKNMKELIIQ